MASSILKIGTEGTVRKANYVPYEEQIKEHIKQTEMKLESLKNQLSKLKEMKYRPGDVVYHKEYGKGFIRDYQLGIRDDRFTNFTIDEVMLKKDSKAYEVAFILNLQGLVLEEDLVPASEAAEGLYGN